MKNLLPALLTVLAVTASGQAASVKFQAEAGLLGTDWAASNTSSPAYITAAVNSTAGTPSTAARVATYNVTFPEPGVYQLYVRARVGPGSFDDDSLFYASSFGTKFPDQNSDWILVNGLANVGFSAPAEVVTGGGSAGTVIWKWINLSQFTGQAGFTVGAGNLAQTFQVGAREDGLDLDQFVFGTSGYTFTVAELDAGGPGKAPVATIDTASVYQTIEGFGGAICFYNGWVSAHPYKLEIYTNAFAGLNLSMLRLANWYRYQGTANFDADAPDFVSQAQRILGRPVPVYMSSWAPPAFLKSNGQVGHGGTLIFTNGGFAYSAFAQYWYDSLLAYRSLGVSPSWISIQNEPDWEASYDSCIFRPAEGVVNGTNYASYSKALDAVYQRLTNLASPPKLLAPEVVHIAYNDLRNYAATMNPASFYGVAYHLYGDSPDGTADGFINNLRSSTNVFPTKPHFMTEYGVSNMIDSATLIHNCLTEGRASGYNHWSLVWPGTDGGLIQIEFPWDRSQWTNAPPGTPTQSRGYWLSPSYWAMKHFSYFITPGSRRVGATSVDPSVRVSAYVSADNLRLVTVLINRSTTTASALSVNPGSFQFANSGVYQTAGANRFQSLGPLGPQLTLPAASLTTVVLDKFVDVGSAANPSPNDKATGVGAGTALSWSPGQNALTHALYIGTSSNALFQAHPATAEFRGILTNTSVHPPLDGGVNYFWRVDEIAGANTNKGPVWSFSTAPTAALVHRYSFSESGGAIVVDSAGGPGWNGTLPNGGTLSGGRLTILSNSSQYASLPAGIVSKLTNFTIEAWVRLNSTANWTRIFDFGQNTATNMYLTPQNGTTSRLRFAITINGAGAEQQITGTAPLPTVVWSHIAVTLKGNTGVLYLNGAAMGTNSAMTLRPLHLGSTLGNYLGKSQYPDPYFNGLIDEFRIYSVALSSAEIAATYALGPSQPLSTAPPTLEVTATPATVTLSWPLASAGFTLQSRTNLLLGSWLNVASPPAQIVGGQWEATLPAPASTGSLFYRLAK